MALGRTSPRDLPLFADLSGREIKDIFRAGEEVSVPAGWSLILEQTPPDAAYLILSGTAAVRVKGDEIAELGPGDIDGEEPAATAALHPGEVRRPDEPVAELPGRHRRDHRRAAR